MNTSLPIIALVGPPNAGKSTLINKIMGESLAVTSELEGTTRDRQYVKTIFQKKPFLLVDTAGLNLSGEPTLNSSNKVAQELETNVQKQIEVAVKQADVIILVVDGKQPIANLDRQVLLKFRKIKKPKILAVNKSDSPYKRAEQSTKFARLGIKPICPISAITGSGIGDMLEQAVAYLPETENLETPAPEGIKVAIVGKPNVGKSSLFNKILNDERAVVSALPGTTRTSIDDHVIIEGNPYTFIDTAGLKKKDHRQSKPDIYSSFQTFKAIRRSDVCFFVLEATELITVQDQKIAGEILAMQKGCVVVVNKIDLFSPETKPKILKQKLQKGRTDDKYRTLQDYISHHFPFLWMCPVFFVSAQSGEGLSQAIKALIPIYERRKKIIDNESLNKFLAKKLLVQPPKRMWDQKEPKIYSIKQTGTQPPTFELLVNFPAAISSQFKHFLENAMIRELDFYGTPIKIHLKRKAGT